MVEIPGGAGAMGDAPGAGYNLFEHTADVGVVAWGEDPAAAFSMAARGMYAVILDTDPLDWQGEGAPHEIRVEVEGAGWPDLLVNWLAEQVFYFDVDGFVPNRIDFALCEPTRLEARLRGIAMADPGDTNGTAIKAVTYHQLEVDVRPGRTELRVIFDI